MVGNAVMEVPGTYCINYAILGNLEPVLHAHITPRYLSEPDDLRKGLPWSYPNADDDSALFDQERDRELIHLLRACIQRRMTAPAPENNFKR